MRGSGWWGCDQAMQGPNYMVEWSSVDLKSFETNSFWIYNILSIDRTSVSTIEFILLSFQSSNINQNVSKMSNDDDVYLKIIMMFTS